MGAKYQWRLGSEVDRTQACYELKDPHARKAAGVDVNV